jgi:LysR family transcriptional regulator (chromosome initiation inhibitor)
MLDARQLDALVAVVEHGSFCAAKALSITLAAVSLRIKSLEDAMGQRPPVRGKRRVPRRPVRPSAKRQVRSDGGGSGAGSG